MLQYTVGEGPGVEAFTRGDPVLVPDMGAEQERWPGFADAAQAAGAAAAFAFPLQLRAIRIGTLEFFRHRADGLASSELSDAVLAADLATAGLVRQARDAEEHGREFAPRRAIATNRPPPRSGGRARARQPPPPRARLRHPAIS